jgi:hypothetical protein
MALMGGPRVSWSILLEAELEGGADAEQVESRLAAATAGAPHLGAAPVVRAVERVELPGLRAAFADEPYRDGHPVVRAAVALSEPGAVLLAAHHGALDGLGLLGLMGVALGAPLASSARGVGAGPPRGAVGPWAAVRAARAALRPPTQVAPARRDRRRAGATLVATAVPALRGGTPALTAAAMRAIAAWNVSRGERSEGAVVAVGASHRSGADLTLDNRAAWLRVDLESGQNLHVRAVFEAASPQPVPAPWRGPRAASILTGAMAARMGSTLLVSNLAAITGPPGLVALSFWPISHGRSAVALGAATVAARTTLTLRAPARRFAEEDLSRLLESVAAELRDDEETDAPVVERAGGAR